MAEVQLMGGSMRETRTHVNTHVRVLINAPEDRVSSALDRYLIDAHISAVNPQRLKMAKRRRAPTSQVELANRKTDAQFIADYLQPRLAFYSKIIPQIIPSSNESIENKSNANTSC